MSESSDQPVPEVQPADAWRMLQAGAYAVDVREPDEFAAGRVPGSVLLPLGQVAENLTSIPRDREVVVVCRSGRRSGEAVRLLQQSGFDRALNLAGGMLAWRGAELPVEE